MSEVAISAIIITKDEALNIERCLSSLQWLPEVVMVDSHSTDRTVELASKYANVRVIDTDWLGFSATKRKAVAAASNDLVLWVDADEVVTQELAREIAALSEMEILGHAAFDLPRKTFFLGEWVKYCGWYPGRVIRLFDRRVCDFNDNHLHEGVDVPPGRATGHLQQDLLHYSYTSLYQYFNKMNQYGRQGALELERKGKAGGKWRMVLSPAFAFFKTYIMKRGYLDSNGLTISIGSAFSNFIKFTNYQYLIREKGKAFKILRRSPRKVIISRTDNIGDVMLTLPLAGLLKQTYPDVEIFFLGKGYTRPVVEACGHISQFIDRESEKLEDSLATIGADAIVHVFPDKEVAKIAAKIGIPVRIGTSHRPFHFRTCNVRPGLGRKNSDLHESQLNVKLSEALGIGQVPPLSEIAGLYGLNPQEQLPEGVGQRLEEGKFNLIIHPRSKGSAAEWPLGHYLEVIKSLGSEKFRFFVTGTATEGGQIQAECPELTQLGQVVDMTGLLTLGQLITFISKVDGLLACSTGPLHIAAALGIPTLGLYVPIRPMHAGRWAPVGAKAEVMEGDAQADGRKLGPEDSIVSITPQRVADRLKAWADGK